MSAPLFFDRNIFALYSILDQPGHLIFASTSCAGSWVKQHSPVANKAEMIQFTFVQNMPVLLGMRYDHRQYLVINIFSSYPVCILYYLLTTHMYNVYFSHFSAKNLVFLSKRQSRKHKRRKTNQKSATFPCRLGNLRIGDVDPVLVKENRIRGSVPRTRNFLKFYF